MNDFLVEAALYFLGGIAAIIAAIVTVVCTTCSDLIKEEAATRLERFPTWLLERAARGLPEDCRQQIFEDEWLPELQHISRGSAGLPLTRLYHSVRFALRLMGGPARAIGKAISSLRSREQRVPRTFPLTAEELTAELIMLAKTASSDHPLWEYVERLPDGRRALNIAKLRHSRNALMHGRFSNSEVPAWFRDAGMRVAVEALLWTDEDERAPLPRLRTLE
ncbi:hypothetical protein ACWEQG_01705 [Microbispora sp. NPDC004025]